MVEGLPNGCRLPVADTPRQTVRAGAPIFPVTRRPATLSNRPAPGARGRSDYHKNCRSRRPPPARSAGRPRATRPSSGVRRLRRRAGNGASFLPESDIAGEPGARAVREHQSAGFSTCRWCLRRGRGSRPARRSADRSGRVLDSGAWPQRRPTSSSGTIVRNLQPVKQIGPSSPPPQDVFHKQADPAARKTRPGSRYRRLPVRACRPAADVPVNNGGGFSSVRLVNFGLKSESIDAADRLHRGTRRQKADSQAPSG